LSPVPLKIERHQPDSTPRPNRPDVDAELVARCQHFWIGQRGGSGSLAKLVGIYKSTSKEFIKEKVIFSISQIGGGEAVDFLVDIAKNDRNLELRKKAIFWLGQSDDPKARKALLEIINR